MISSTSDGNKIFFRALPVELLLHAMVLWLFWNQYQSILKPNDLIRFVAIVAGLISVKFIYLIIKHVFEQAKSESYNTTTVSILIISNILCGLSWGLGISYFSVTITEFSLTDSYLIVLVANLILAAIIGAAMWSWVFSSFVIPLFIPPLYILLSAPNIDNSYLWVSLAMSSLILFKIANMLETIFKTFRQASKQHTAILKELAHAKQQAMSKEREASNSRINIEKEMEKRLINEEKVRNSERETNRILQDMQDTYFRVDTEGKFTRLSPSARFLFEANEESLIGHCLKTAFLNSSDYTRLVESLKRHGGYILDFETQFKSTSKETCWVSINAHFSQLEIHKQKGFEGTIRDITVNKQSDALIAHEKNRLHVTLESIGDAVITTDASGSVTYLNPMAELMSGCNTAAAKEKTLCSNVTFLDESGKQEVNLPLQQWLTSKSRGQLNSPIILQNRRDNKKYTVEVTGSPILDNENKCFGYVLVFRNMTKLRALTKQLTYQATHDALTGLINRQEFESRVEAALHSAKTEGKIHALCYIDLDQFKIVNDTCGHHTGDTLLKEVTTILQKKLRSSDTLARLGGDEFGILLVGCDLKKAHIIAEECRKAVEVYRLNWKGKVFRIGASIGLITIDKSCADLEELFKDADSACYKAKEFGRNNVQVIKNGDQAIEQQRQKMSLMQRIQSALENDLFELHFQTIAPLNGTKTTGKCCEILVRMIDDSHTNKYTIMPPGAFIPTAERYHLMPKIDKWIISNTLQYFRKTRSERKNWDMFSINLSAQTIRENNIIEWISEEIDSSGVPASMICFDIAENSAIENKDLTIELIKNLKSKGCRFALDDFGAGISSFGYLNQFPVHYIKIDGSLVKEIISNPAGFAVLQAINNIAHVVNIKTMAEHVESEQILEGIKELGIDYAQGFAIDQPIPFLKQQLKKKAS